jgi:hypothetical protein
VIDFELRTDIENRRAEIEERRRAAPGRSGEWAADCAIHELDRLAGWLNHWRQRALAADRARETPEQASAVAALELER